MTQLALIEGDDNLIERDGKKYPIVISTEGGQKNDQCIYIPGEDIHNMSLSLRQYVGDKLSGVADHKFTKQEILDHFGVKKFSDLGKQQRKKALEMQDEEYKKIKGYLKEGQIVHRKIGGSFYAHEVVVQDDRKYLKTLAFQTPALPLGYGFLREGKLIPLDGCDLENVRIFPIEVGGSGLDKLLEAAANTKGLVAGPVPEIKK